MNRWYRYVGRGGLKGQFVLCLGWAHRAGGPRNGLFRDEWGVLTVAPFLRCVRRIPFARRISGEDVDSATGDAVPSSADDTTTPEGET